MYYRQFRKGINNITLVPENFDFHSAVQKNPNIDHYTSIYKYSQNQFDHFIKTKTLSGIKDVISNLVVFDFDGKSDLELARRDTLNLILRLKENNISEDNIGTFFSSNKGFHVELKFDKDLTVNQYKALVKNLGKGFETFDPVVNDANRAFRLLGSYNPKSGLYKIYITLDELLSLTIEEIKELAKNPSSMNGKDFNKNIISFPESLEKLCENTEVSKKVEVEEIETNLNWSKKPIGYPACRWAISNGYFKKGERHAALMALVSYLRNQGVNKIKAYHEGLGTVELQAKINKCEEYDKEEFYSTCIESIYDDGWKGGQYSCKQNGDPWLHSYCQSLGKHKCSNKDENCFIEIDDFASKFTDFAVNIDKNRLFFGIPEIDEKVMITTSMLVGLLGAPSAGKTTLLLNFLEESNKSEIESTFFSMDMGLPLVYLRLIQKHFGKNKQEVFDIFMNDEQERIKIQETIKEIYKHTKFSFKTGLNMEGIRNAVIEHQHKIDKKVKLVGIDYLECIKGPYGDDNANISLIAQQCKDLANDLDTCVMLLLQTQKNSGDPSDPLLSMRNIKGASAIEQACAAVLTLSRPGFSPITPEDDKFATISLVKGRMDTLFTVDLTWNGLKGSFSTLNSDDKQLLFDVRNRKKEMDKEKIKDKGGW